MNAKLKVGFVGCGGIANGKHFPGMEQQKDYADMVAFCDLVRERAERAAAKYGTPDAKVYTDYRELLADKSIDVVFVLTPNNSHAEITCAALEAGKHVLCEKPMAATEADARRMLEARDKSGKLLTIGYQYRHFPVNQVAKKTIDDGWLGDIYYAESTYLRRRGVPTWGVFTDKSKQGGGPLIDIGTHAIDLALWFMDNYEIASVTAAAFKGLVDDPAGNVWGPWDPAKFEVEDSAFGFIRMKNGALLSVEASWALNIPDAREACVTVCGTKGGAQQLQGDYGPGSYRWKLVKAEYDRLVTVTPDGPEKFIPMGDMADEVLSLAPVREMDSWLTDLEGGRPHAVRAEQAAAVVRVIETMYESARQGRTIRLD